MRPRLVFCCFLLLSVAEFALLCRAGLWHRWARLASLSLRVSGRIFHGAHQLGFGCHGTVHFGARAELPDAAHVALEVHVQDQLVAGLDHALEARLVDAHEVIQSRFRIVWFLSSANVSSAA